MEKRTGFKEFRLTSYAVDHPTSIVVLTFILIVMGLTSYRVPEHVGQELDECLIGRGLHSGTTV